MASKKYCDCRFGDYGGRLRWRVTHPKYRDAIVAAPDDIAAIKAAADWWGDDWLDNWFYIHCKVYKA